MASNVDPAVAQGLTYNREFNRATNCPQISMSRLILIFCLLAAIAAGCRGREKSVPEPKPRPVEVDTLTLSDPPNSRMVTASVASWKTEQIGFEVGGRIEWVAEPNTDIEGRLIERTTETVEVLGYQLDTLVENVILDGTEIAKLEDERYRLQVASAKAEILQVEESINAATIELEKSLPSQLRAAQAEKELAETERQRSQRLFDQNAGSQSDVDRDEANYQTAVSRIEQLEANVKAKEAEIQSLNAQLLQAQRSLRDAERSLEDCTLYSSFRGQIADVAVVPGSVVSAGEPVATIQLMDPIKIELEVSADDSRRLRNRQRFPVQIDLADDTTVTREGYLYLIDPVADPQTRTFTLTILMLNQKNMDQKSESDQGLPTTEQMWRVNFRFLPGAEEGKFFIADEAVLRDEQGPYLWRVTNIGQGDPMPPDRILKVEKLRIRLLPARLPFLGNWVFQEITFDDDRFDPTDQMVLGKLNVSEGDPNEWSGDAVLIDRESKWLVRPGDLVRVNLGPEDWDQGYFVPMDAISIDDGQASIFVIDPTEDPSIVRRQPVRVVDRQNDESTSAMRRIQSMDGGSLENLRYVTRGAHYLRDGEPVLVATHGGEPQ